MILENRFEEIARLFTLNQRSSTFITSAISAFMCLIAVGAAAPGDDPRLAMQALMTAMAQQNSADLLAACDIPTPADRPYVEAVANMLLAGRKLSDAATAKFGPAGDAIGKGPIAAADEADVPHAAVTITGDTAELVMPGQTLPLRFRKVDGVWKFRVIDFGGSQPRDMQKQTVLTEMFGDAMAEAAHEIEQDGFANAADAEAAIRQKLNNVLMKSLAPATQPTTRPAN